MLEIKNLSVEIEGKEILKDVSLKLEKGNVYALMGKNGSGKSTLSNVLMGNPRYKIKSGKILINTEDITNLKSNERAQKGLFLSFQYPPEIQGVTVSNFLRNAYNSINRKISFLEFQRKLEKYVEKLGIDKEFLTRYLNEGFSGGEKKKMEILQMLVLNPRIAVLDETDSGLDADSLRIIARGIRDFMSRDKTILVITHHMKIFDYIKPDRIFVMNKGKIVKNGGEELIKEIEEKGYGLK
ncbi:MAG: Fe-S cluster assembly ATPase SufC [archaeon]